MVTPSDTGGSVEISDLIGEDCDEGDGLGDDKSDEGEENWSEIVK